MKEQKFDYGMIGLGTMGRNLVYNMSDRGYTVIGFDKNDSQVQMLKKESCNEKISATSNLEEFLQALKSPKVIMMLVPAGKIVDEVINELKPFLSDNDLLIDCGNSHFIDTNRRIEQLEKSAIHFMGVGISGGESGARYGPSIMPGCPKDVYERVAGMLKSIAAKVHDEPCVTWLGTGSAGHYVKMVHNGIEYGLMQLIAEAYHLLKDVGKLNNNELHYCFAKWNEGFLQSYLLEITADIFLKKDEFSNTILVDLILDSAKQNGTGGWTSDDAINLQIPIPVIDVAVTMRDMSALKTERELASAKLAGSTTKHTGGKPPFISMQDQVVKQAKDKAELIVMLEQALYFSMITVYAQGMSLLQAASKKYAYDLNLGDIAKIWRGGCIIRARLLEDIHTAFSTETSLANLMLCKSFADKLQHSETGIRYVIRKAIDNGIPMPAMMMSLGYYDSYRSGWLPANLIQAQRDYFGAHTYERNDKDGIFHTKWNQFKS
jgi:6-phosphogluconate dehydrogenase